MSRRRKHVLQDALQQEVKAPIEGQEVVRALGSRGDNLVEVEAPDGQTSLVLLPARFNKKLWVRRGGYLIVQRHGQGGEPAKEATGKDAHKSRISGTIEAVLYAADIAELQRLDGVWPKEFAAAPARSAVDESDKPAEPTAAPGDTDGSDIDDDMPPLEPNTNRPVLNYNDYDDDSSEDDQGNLEWPTKPR